MLRWTERALSDLIAIGDYIAADNPHAARSWVEELRQRAVKASKMPRTGRVVPEIGSDAVREVFQRTVAPGPARRCLPACRSSANRKRSRLPVIGMMTGGLSNS